MRSVVLIATLFLICRADFVRSDDELVLRDTKSTSNDFIVLQTGRVVRGKLTPRQGGYDIKLSTGRMFVASEQVRFRASTMTEAYQRMRDSLPQLTPETHLELARWCLTNKLEANAKREALDALHLDPYNTEARRLLEALVRREKEAAAPQTRDVSLPMMPPVERRSLGGLPVNLARDFTRYVQPIVVNKCGNAACHGKGKNEFEVVSLKGGSNAWTSERNLAAILKQIDASNPAASPILAAMHGNHGNSRTLSFSGPTGRQQISKLRDWVNGVSREFGSYDGASDSKPVLKKTATISAPQETSAVSTVHLDTDQQFLQEAVHVNRIDRFSPDEFNKRYHGHSASRVEHANNQIANTDQNGY